MTYQACQNIDLWNCYPESIIGLVVSILSVVFDSDKVIILIIIFNLFPY